MTLACEVHRDCADEVVAKVGLPGRSARWVCRRGFDEIEANRDAALLAWGEEWRRRENE